MSGQTQEKIISGAHAAIQSLKKLLLEQEQLLKEQHVECDVDKAEVIARNIELINLGVAEGDVMFMMVQHMKCVELEMQKLKDLAKRLDAESTWLTDELSETRKKLMDSEKTVVQLEEEKKHLEFTNEMLKSDLKQLKSVEYEGKEMMDASLEKMLVPEPTDKRKSMQSESAPLLVREASAGCDLSVRHHGLCNLVTHYVSKGKYEVAVPLCKQAIEDLERTTGHYHPDVAILLNMLALVYRDQKMYQESEDLLKDALDIREKTLGEDHPAVATTLNNLAVLYGKRGKHEEAENLSKRSLKLREQKLGKDHPDVVKHLKTLAMLYQNHGKYEEAIRCFNRALEISQAKLMPDDSNIAKIKVNLAHCYLKQKNYKDAEMIYKQVLIKGLEQIEAEEKVLAGMSRTLSKSSKIDPYTFNIAQKNLNSIYKQQGKLGDAELLNRCMSRARSGTIHSISPRQPLKSIKNTESLEKRRYSISSPSKSGYEQICRDRARVAKNYLSANLKQKSPAISQLSLSPNKKTTCSPGKKSPNSLKKKICYILGIENQ